jgi:hypothetical protein
MICVLEEPAVSERETALSGVFYRSGKTRSSLDVAILRTVAYADLFDYPLTVAEVHRYLVGTAAPLSAVHDALEDDRLSKHRLAHSRGYVSLYGRTNLVERRLYREAVSARMWRKGMRYGRAISSLPYVRLVAVTGTLAVNNMEPGQDIDYLIVTTPHRVWLARLFVLAFVRLGRLEKLTICPNYVLSSSVLSQFEPSLFTAHELAQMVPLFGLDTYQELLQVNDWARSYLPNAFVALPDRFTRRVSPLFPVLKRGAERMLTGRLGDLWEERERGLKIARLSQEAQECRTNAASFTPECCKGHMGDHGTRISDAYKQRLRQVGLDADVDPTSPQETE